MERVLFDQKSQQGDVSLFLEKMRLDLVESLSRNWEAVLSYPEVIREIIIYVGKIMKESFEYILIWWSQEFQESLRIIEENMLEFWKTKISNDLKRKYPSLKRRDEQLKELVLLLLDWYKIVDNWFSEWDEVVLLDYTWFTWAPWIVYLTISYLYFNVAKPDEQFWIKNIYCEAVLSNCIQYVTWWQKMIKRSQYVANKEKYDRRFEESRINYVTSNK